MSCMPKNNLCFYRRPPPSITSLKGGPQDLMLFDGEDKLIRGQHHKDFEKYLKIADQKAEEKGAKQ